MRLYHFIILAAAGLTLLPAGRLPAAETEAPAAPGAASGEVSDTPETPTPRVAETVEEFTGPALTENSWLDFEEVPEARNLAVRFGWWGVHNSGSQNKTGEWQGLNKSAPFWEVDGLFSNGNRTLDFFLNMPENQTGQMGLNYYNGPGLSLKANYDNFQHRLDHDPLRGFYPVPPNTVIPDTSTPGYAMWGEDLNLGQDYAINVQKLKADFKGNLTENIKWRLNVWGMEKSGTRQANALTHCYNLNPPGGNRCHVVSQGQQIDWLTMEIQPVIEARVTDWLTVEYSRTMRSFQQRDQLVLNNYSGNATAAGNFGWAPYGVVPESVTAIDRVKVAAQLGEHTDLYMLGFVGNNENQDRSIDRNFNGVDARITNQSIEGVQVTGYGKLYNENTEGVSSLITAYPTFEQLVAVPGRTTRMPWEPIDRNEFALGLKGRWQPFLGEIGTLRRGLALTGGYEYRDLERDDADSYIVALDGVAFPAPNYFPRNTTSNRVWAGVEEKWAKSLTSYMRYSVIETAYPMNGITPGTTAVAGVNAALNSNLPTHEDRIEIGSTWTPTDYLMVNGQFWIENTYNHTQYANFDEDSYPFLVNVWYAPAKRWSVSAGYAQLTNWIAQDITLGAGTSITTPWDYAGRSDVVNLGLSYAWTDNVRLIGGYEYVRSRNAYAEPLAPAGVSYADLPTYSAVSVDTQRVSAGMDFLLNAHMSAFLRYNYYDYSDLTAAYNAGDSHMVLSGLTGTF